MKPTLKYTMIALALGTGLASLTAEPEKATTAKKDTTLPLIDQADITPNIRVKIEYVEMPLLTMAELMDDETATETDTVLRARVAELIQSGKAKLIDIQMLTAPDGHKATSESIREFIYPTEYEPAEIPNTIHIHGDGTKTAVINKDFATGPTPTAFETRNLGTTLEIEASIDPDAPYINVRFAQETVDFVEYATYSDWKNERGTADIVMPIMYNMRVTMDLNVADGKPALATSLSPKDDKGFTDLSRKILVFIRADILSVR